MPEECFPPFFSDIDRISQIISIFLDNAISYSPEHSGILLEASIKKNYLAISIIDHGMGISEEDIFNRYPRGRMHFHNYYTLEYCRIVKSPPYTSPSDLRLYILYHQKPFLFGHEQF